MCSAEPKGFRVSAGEEVEADVHGAEAQGAGQAAAAGIARWAHMSRKLKSHYTTLCTDGV